MHSKTAIGKLGVVLAPGRSPRLVVDSSISMVTANTVLPNHMLLPRISDVIQCAPDSMASQQMTQLTLDVAKAHRRILFILTMAASFAFMQMGNCTDALLSTLVLVQVAGIGGDWRA